MSATNEIKTKKTNKSIKTKKITMNSILGWYKNDGTRSDTMDLDYDYVQVELMGNHANDVDESVMLISKSDINLIMNFKWYLGKGGYPVTYGSIDNEYKFIPPITCHRFLNPDTPSGYVVDHINRNRLDNRRTNYRIITQKQNSYNRKKPKNSKRKYKGVKQYGKKGNKKYCAVIHKDGTKHEIKGFKTEKEAAEVYDMMAEDLFGEFAGKNFK